MLAYGIDQFLLVTAAGTAALIVWKAVELARARLPADGAPASLDEQLEKLERGLSLLASVASAAPFVGLAATVLHIIEALGRLGLGGDISTIAMPIAQALRSTLLGLACAVPAVVAYNLFQRRLQLLTNRGQRALQSSESHP
jgi:biopolymer transport protein ExbB